MKKIKILYLTTFPQIGGGETALIYLLSKLNRKKFEPIVIIPEKGQLSVKLKTLQIKTFFLKLSPYLIRTFFIPGVSIKGIRKLIYFTKKINPNLIHLNHLNLAIYGGITAKIFNLPIVATSHGPWDSYYYIQDIINNFFIDRIIANTEDVARALLRRKIIQQKKINTTHFGIDTSKFKPGNQKLARKKLNLPFDKFVITIVGRLDPVKDHETFFEAARIVEKKHPNILLFIVGSNLGNFSKSSKKNGWKINLNNYPSLLRKTIFAGFKENMPEIYQASDLLVSSSISESFGLALAEASACAIPVVATNTGGQRFIIKNNQTGFLVPPKNPQALAQKINLLIENKKLQIGFGKLGREHINDNFDLNNYIKNIQQIYLESIQPK